MIKRDFLNTKFSSLEGSCSTHSASPHFLNPSQIWHVRVDPWCTVPCQISHWLGELLHLWAKSHKFDQLCNYRAFVPTPLTDLGQIWRARVDPWYVIMCTAKFHLHPFILSPLRGAKSQIWPFLAKLYAVARLSVCNVRAPYSAGWNFRQCFYAIWYLGHPLTFTENFMEIVPGEPICRRFKRKRGSQI